MKASSTGSELNFNANDIIKLVFMIGDIRLKEEQTGVAGDVFILDASIATPANFAKFTPAILKKLFVCIQVSDKFMRCLHVQTKRLIGSPVVTFHLRD